MTRVKKKSFIYLIGLICITVFITISQYNYISSPNNQKNSPKTAQVQYNDDSLTAHLNFSIFEYSEDEGIEENVSSIDIDLESSRWNVTNLELNITDIYFEKEIKTIVDQYDLAFTIEKNFPRLGIQIEIEDPTIIYGVYIYGNNYSLIPTDVYIQINGNNEITGAPDESKIYGNPILLNMTKSAGENWHRQLFPEPIPLSKGTYYLIMNGSSIGLSPPTQIKYSWFYKNFDPNNPTLNTSRYHRTEGWSVDYRYQGSPLLYKLIQRINKTFYPNEINMTAEIDDINHPINKGNKPGSGYLDLSIENFNPNTENFHIPIKNNKSNALIFNLSYHINLNHSLLCAASVLIRENIDNIWIIKPDLIRFGINYYIKFDYPNHWSNLNLYRNGLKLKSTGNYSNDGDILEIFNNTIMDPPILWKITANSTNIPIDLNIPQISWSAGQLLEFQLKGPVKAGNYSYILYDKNGFEKKFKFYIDPDASTSFNYSISSNPVNGNWKAFIYWNNETDAGVQTQIFQITGGVTIISTPGNTGSDSSSGNTGEESEDMTPIIILAIVLIGGITSAVSISSFEGFKRLKRIRDQHRNKLLNQFKDLMNLNYIMITEKKSGLNIYEQYIAGQEIDATLISGFLNAIRAFGIELTKSNNQSQTISLEYKDSKVLMSEFKSFRIIVIMKERPSEQMINSITDLSYSIENKYSEVLENFKGSIIEFAGISDLIEEHLHTSFIAPLKVVEQIGVKLSISERAMINKAKELMKEYNLNYFHSTYLISEQKFKYSDVETIFNLINKKIFQPTSSDSAGFKK